MKKYLNAALVVFALGFSLSSEAATKRTLIGECNHINGLRYKIYYTNRTEKRQHIVQVDASVDGEPEIQTQKWYAQGWDSANGSKAFIIARKFGLAMVNGDSNLNALFAPGIPSEPIHCKNDLKPVLKDFPVKN